jgi:hypothetical protein
LAGDEQTNPSFPVYVQRVIDGLGMRRGDMDNVKRFEQYAADFEVAFSDDDWSQVGRHFAEEAVYETLAGPPMGACLEGRDAVLASMKQTLDGFDRRFDSREVTFLEGPEMRGDSVWLRARVKYAVADAPDLVLEGVSTATFDGGRIIRLEDSYPDGTADTVVQYLTAHASKLHPVKGGAV